MMGKYDHALKPMTGDKSLDNTKLWILHDIANELAEANRLKRVELRKTRIVVDSEIEIKMITEEDLEDKTCE